MFFKAPSAVFEVAANSSLECCWSVRLFLLIVQLGGYIRMLYL